MARNVDADTPPPEALVEGVRRLPILLLILVAFGCLIGWAQTAGQMRTAFDGVRQPRLTESEAALPANIPPVEPLVLKELPPDAARRINAATPFTREPIPPARPFYVSGTLADKERATDCLAAAIWYEAGAETLSGRKAVAQVVLNRVRHPAFPKSVCAVVFQGAERPTGCQFTFTCDGAMARPPSTAGWAVARGLARIMLTGEVFRPVGTATHYHTDWVLPNWSGTLDKVHKEGAHLFFRWMGWWGSLPAFRSRYAGKEPVVAQLASLSPFHADGRPGELILPDLSGLSGSSSAALPAGLGGGAKDGLPSNPYGLTPVYQSPSADFLAFVVPHRFDPGMMLSLVLFSCSVKPYCKVMVWTDAKRAPSKMPVTEEQLQAMAFSYLRNRSAGIDKALWNCALFPRSDLSQCMKPRPAASTTPRGSSGGDAAPLPAPALPQNTDR